MIRDSRHGLVALLIALLTACSGSVELGPAPGGPLGGLQRMVIVPAAAALVIAHGTPATQAFRVVGTFADGERDITEHVTLTNEDPAVGSLDDALFTTRDDVGGKARIVASGGEQSAEATLTIRLELDHVRAGVPADAAARFAAAAPGGGTFDLLYPPDGVLLPPNLVSLEIMWAATAEHDLWQVQISSDVLDVRLHTADAGRLQLTDDEWHAIAGSSREGEVTVRVRGLGPGGTATLGETKPIEVAFARDSIEGGIYYWAAVQSGGIFRYDFGKPAKAPEPFYTNAQEKRCVACHAISRDGTRMALTFEGGNGPSGILDVASRELAARDTYKANFQVFTADNRHLIGSHGGVLTVRDAGDGATVATLDAAGPMATMPDVSPDGGRLAFVRAAGGLPPDGTYRDWTFGGGSIMVAPLKGVAIEAPQVLVQGGVGQPNNFYPSFSPDGEWLVFNRSSGDSYSDDDATLWVVDAAGGAPIAMQRADVAGDLRNSWARWSPFVQQYRGKKLLWLTFSSTRDYGNRLINTGKGEKDKQPQLWMVAFDPERAAAGEDPSYPAFYLPFQDIATNNHIAQWTTQIVPLK